MLNEKLSHAVYKKMDKELQIYAQHLLNLPPEEILKHASEYVIKTEMVEIMKKTVLSSDEARALLIWDHPLNLSYSLLDDWHTALPQTLFEAITGKAEELVAENQLIARIPLYEHPLHHAKSFGMMEAYWKSEEQNIQCSKFMDAAISEFSKDNRLDDEAIRSIVDRFGIERTTFVLINSIRCQDCYDSLSSENQTLISGYFISADLDNGTDLREKFVAKSSPELLNQFLSILRDEFFIEKSQEQETPSKGKPSVREKLGIPAPKKHTPPKPINKKGLER